jgi:hypothetical protein
MVYQDIERKEAIMTQNSKNDREPAAVPGLLRERELAARWGATQRTLQRWRADCYGPPFLRIGGRILYRLTDVMAFEERNRWSGE